MIKNILITGASSGIGLATAVFLANKKHNVLGTTRNLSTLNKDLLIQRYISDHTKYKISAQDNFRIEKTSEKLPVELAKLRHALANIKFIQMNVHNDVSVADAATKALEMFHDKIDVLINNAGSGMFGSIEELPIDEVKQLFETNVIGLLRVIQNIVPSMRKNRHGKIINISSLAAIMAIPFFSHYSATKAAVERLTEGLRMELNPFNINVTAVEPGDINTNFNVNMLHKTKPDIQLTSQNLSEIISNVPLNPDSPYYQKATKCWQIITQVMIESPSPTVVAQKINKIIQTPNPKMRYKVGSLMQTLPTYIAQRFLSDKIVQLGYERHFKIK